jgi:AbrB family looped-hinge helix DNA binding protein
MKTIVGEGGRIVIPSSYRKAMGIKPGDEVILVLEENEIRLLSLRKAITRVQESVRKYIPENVRLVDELIKERREEASHE